MRHRRDELSLEKTTAYRKTSMKVNFGRIFVEKRVNFGIIEPSVLSDGN